MRCPTSSSTISLSRSKPPTSFSMAIRIDWSCPGRYFRRTGFPQPHRQVFISQGTQGFSCMCSEQPGQFRIPASMERAA